MFPPTTRVEQTSYYSLRNPRTPVSKRKFTTTYGIDTISLRGLQIWQDLPQSIKNSDSLNIFKLKKKDMDLNFSLQDMQNFCSLYGLYWYIHLYSYINYLVIINFTVARKDSLNWPLFQNLSHNFWLKKLPNYIYCHKDTH